MLKMFKIATFTLGICALVLLGGCQSNEYDKVPITTQSKEALKYFMKGRDLYDKLRRVEAAANFKKALELDPDFAMVHLHSAFIAPNTQSFTEHMSRAVELVDKVSIGEKYKILGMQAAFNGQPEKEGEYFHKLVQDYPEDERALLLLGNHYFFQNDFNRAIGYYRQAIQIKSDFSLSYNQLGYCHRFLENYQEAEEAFKEYIKLVPEDPNPYDSYGDLLTKMGRFEESISLYEKAIKQDPNFTSSYIGVSTNLNLLEQHQKARQVLKDAILVLNEENEQRRLQYAIMISYLDEESNDSALTRMQHIIEFDESLNDTLHVAEDLLRLGDILIEFQQYDKSHKKVEAANQLIQNSHVSAEMKNNTRIGYLFRLSRLMIKMKKFEKANDYLAELETEISQLKDRNRTQRYYGLLGLLALEKGEYDRALGEFQRSSQRNPLILFYMAMAYEKKGDVAKAIKYYNEAANFNRIGSMYFALIRKKALQKLDDLKT
jgi:tetratricopeptide (TPR) repeat protein